jgi:hypothetical protein
MELSSKITTNKAQYLWQSVIAQVVRNKWNVNVKASYASAKNAAVNVNATAGVSRDKISKNRLMGGFLVE